MFENTNDFAQKRVEANYRHAFYYKSNHIYKCIRLRLAVIQIRIILENVISANN